MGYSTVALPATSPVSFITSALTPEVPISSPKRNDNTTPHFLIISILISLFDTWFLPSGHE